jgi:hypothetical protein
MAGVAGRPSGGPRRRRRRRFLPLITGLGAGPKPVQFQVTMKKSDVISLISTQRKTLTAVPDMGTDRTRMVALGLKGIDSVHGG